MVTKPRSWRWLIEKVGVPVLVAVISAAVALYVGVHSGARSAITITGTASNYDPAAWGTLFFDREALDGISKWIQAENLASGAAPQLHYTLGRAYHQLGDNAKASTEYAMAQSVPDAGYLRALTLLSMNDPRGARILLEEVLASDPKHIGATYYLGVCLLQEQDYIHARDRFQLVVAQRPESLQAWHNLGVCDLHLRRYDSALSEFTRVSEKNPVFARAVFDKGVALFHTGKKIEALEAFSTAIHLESRLARDLDTQEHLEMQSDPVVGQAIRALISGPYG